jgi:hypothetical protein
MAKLRREAPRRARWAGDAQAEDVIRESGRRTAGLAAGGAICEGVVGEVAFDDGATGAVEVVEVPAPGAADQVEGAACLADGEVGLDLEGGEMFSGSSGAMAPMGAQFWSKEVDTLSARLVELTTLNRMDMLFAS